MTKRAPSGWAAAARWAALRLNRSASSWGTCITLTTVDLGKTSALVDSLNQLAYSMQNVDQDAVAEARRYTQSFTSIFGQQVPASYIDLGHFLILLTQTTKDQGVNAAARDVAQAITETVVAEKSGKDKPGATGISVYFPTGQVYQQPAAGPQSYTKLADRFAQDSLWDEFLLFHYGGRTFKSEHAGRQRAPDRRGDPRTRHG